MAEEITGVGRGVEALLASGPLGATVGCLLWWIWRKDGLDRDRSKAAGDRADQRERDHSEAQAVQRRELIAIIDRQAAELATVNDKRAAALERMGEAMRSTLDAMTRRAAEKEKRSGSDTNAGSLPGLAGGDPPRPGA